MSPALLGGLAGFAAGSVPFGLLLALAAGRTDPRTAGSGNVGATNVARTGGTGLGLLTLVLDATKGALPAAFFAARAGPAAGAAAGACAVLGHCFSPWLRFRGGKGVATLLGTSLALAFPWGFLAFVATWLALIAWRRQAAVSSLAAAWLLPLAAWLSGRPPLIGWTFLGLAALVTFQHRSNIRRLVADTEPRLGAAAGPETP